MIEKKKKWKLADFDYSLPEKYIAQYPAKRRDLSKLMVLHRETGKIEHKIFSSLPEYLKRNDLVILNGGRILKHIKPEESTKEIKNKIWTKSVSRENLEDAEKEFNRRC